MENPLSYSSARRALLGLGFVGGLVMAAVGPAAAADSQTTGSGSGTLNPDLTFVSEVPPCASVGSSFGGAATINSATVSNTSGTVTYTGDVSVTWSIAGPASGSWYEGPEGTYGTDSTCSSTAGTPFDVTATLSGTNASGDTERRRALGTPCTPACSSRSSRSVIRR